MTTTEQLTLPAWEAGADRFGLTPGAEPKLCDVEYPIAGTTPETTTPEADLPDAMDMPTVLLPISPLAAFDCLRHAVRKDLRKLVGELEDYLATLGIPLAPPAVVLTPAVAPVVTAPQKRRRWHR